MNSFPDRSTRPHLPADANGSAEPIDWPAVEAILHHDPGGRGVAGFRCAEAWLDAGQLRAAALNLASSLAVGQVKPTIGIVTGFCAVLPDRVTCETDGPPGALFLALALELLGCEVLLISDTPALPLLEVGAKLMGLERMLIVPFPFELESERAADRWIENFLRQGPGTRLTHLISIERPGPSHTLASLSAQARSGPAPVAEFEMAAPPEDRDQCHSMRGTVIDQQTAPIHRLFEAIELRKLPITTIGIGDGGNELGMGHFLWEDLLSAIATGPAGRIICRIATEFTLIAGVSNWGAYGLALTLLKLAGKPPENHWFQPAGQRELIEALVADAGAVDGRTLRAEATVDGLLLDEYLQPLESLRSLLFDSRA